MRLTKTYCYNCKKPTVTLVEKSGNIRCAGCGNHKELGKIVRKRNIKYILLLSTFIFVFVAWVAYMYHLIFSQ